MNEIFNIAAIGRLMDDPPKGQRLINFFNGDMTAISDEQKLNVISILKSRSENTIDQIAASILT